MSQAITPDPSQQIDLYFRVNASGVPIALTFKNSDGTPYTFVYDDFQLRIKEYVGHKKNAILMGFGTGLTLTSNVLTISFTEENSKVRPGEYYWELYKNDYGRPWITGKAYAYEGIAPDITEATTITVNEAGYDITVTISEASVVGSATTPFRGAYDASVNTYPASGGSGTGGAIQAGDEWYFSVAGTFGGDVYPIGTIAKALTNTPGQTASNWRLI